VTGAGSPISLSVRPASRARSMLSSGLAILAELVLRLLKLRLSAAHVAEGLLLGVFRHRDGDYWPQQHGPKRLVRRSLARGAVFALAPPTLPGCVRGLADRSAAHRWA
jgi:hypothetical protein